MSEMKKDNNINEEGKEYTVKKGPEFKAFKWNSPIEKEKFLLIMQKNRIKALNNPKYKEQMQLNNEQQKARKLVPLYDNKGNVNIINVAVITIITTLAICSFIFLVIK